MVGRFQNIGQSIQENLSQLVTRDFWWPFSNYESQQHKSSSRFASLKSLLSDKKWYKKEILIFSTAINLFALALPIFILQIYDRILPNSAHSSLSLLVIGLSICLIFDGILRLCRAWIASWNGARFEHLSRCMVMDRYMKADLQTFERQPLGNYIEQVNAISSLRDFFASQLPLVLIDIPFAILFLVLIGYLGGWLLLVPLGFLLLFGLLAGFLGLGLRDAIASRSEADNQRHDFLLEMLNSIHTVKALALKPLLLRQFQLLQEESAESVRRITLQSGLAHSLGSLFGQLNMVAIVAAGGFFVLQGTLSAGELAACTLLAGRALQPLQSTMGLWTNFQTIQLSAQRLDEALTLPLESLDQQGLRKPDLPSLEGRIDMENVCFHYQGSQHLVLKDVNLTVGAGEIIGIEGDNSSGRSSLLLLLAGLILPTKGRILVDCEDIAFHDPRSLREQISLIRQHTDIYSGTIIQNLTNFRSGPIINEALTLTYLLGLDDEIKRLPQGYDTEIGAAGGENLPAGITQRIAIVRALIDRPRILLFDEANTALDTQADGKLRDLFQNLKGEMTIILVSSRPSLLKIADQRYRLTEANLIPLPVLPESPPEALTTTRGTPAVTGQTIRVPSLSASQRADKDSSAQETAS